jgi:hypothetical protein
MILNENHDKVKSSDVKGYSIVISNFSKQLKIYENGINIKIINFDGELMEKENLEVDAKGTAFFEPKTRENEYYVKISSDYFISSIPGVGKNNIIVRGQNNIRVSKEDLKWLYSNITIGTVVTITN